MQIEPFAIEEYFALYEFTTPYLLCASDCESMTVEDLLRLAGRDLASLGDLHLGYTESQGSPLLRAAVAATYTTADAQHVIVLGSPEEGIYLTMRALLQPGDHVVVLTPAYASLLNLARHISGSVSEWQLQPDGRRWRFDLDRLAALVSDKTKLIVINFPHNPTGCLPEPQELQAIIDIARRHNAWLFCDEMYRGLEPQVSATLPSVADRYERGLVLSGLSKVYGLPGLRSGWLVVHDDDLRAELINWKFYTSICPPAPTEFLALAALEARSAIIDRNTRLIESNLDLAGAFFARWPDLFTWRPPAAGPIALVGLNRPSAAEYCHQLAREAGVLLLPSSCMGYGDNHVRMGFGRVDFERALVHYEQFLDAGSF